MVLDPSTLIHSAVLPQLIDAYTYELHEHEYLTDVLTSVTIYSIANTIVQLSRGGLQGFNARLLFSFVLIGSMDGSWGFWWYPNIERLIPGASLGPVILKTFLDLAIYSTLFDCCYLFLITTLEHGLTKEGMQAGLQRVRADFLTVWLGGELFWIPANFANYYFVPLELRVLGAASALLIYTVGLSFFELWAREQKSGTALSSKKITFEDDGSGNISDRIDRGLDSSIESIELGLIHRGTSESNSFSTSYESGDTSSLRSRVASSSIIPDDSIEADVGDSAKNNKKHI